MKSFTLTAQYFDGTDRMGVFIDSDPPLNVPPTFRGMPLGEYLSLPITSRLQPVTPEAIARTQAAYLERCEKQNRTPWFEKHVHGPRDTYGILGT